MPESPRPEGRSDFVAGLRQALGCFLTGVTVVSTVDELGRPRGITVNSFTSVSLDPPLVLVCIARTAASYSAFSAAPGFAVNVLSEAQSDVAVKFASKDSDKFAHVEWFYGGSGAPILSASLSWLDCIARERFEVGDHVILIGHVMGYQYRSARPLGYFKGGFVDFGLEQVALDHARRHNLVLGCIVEREDCLLLCRKAGERLWTLPFSHLQEPAAPPKAALKRLLMRLGVDLEPTFLYSVFDLPESDAVCVTYRGAASSPVVSLRGRDLESRLTPIAELPWPAITGGPVTNMLRRYVEERSSGRFGIYAEYEGGGRLARLHDSPQPWARGVAGS